MPRSHSSGARAARSPGSYCTNTVGTGPAPKYVSARPTRAPLSNIPMNPTSAAAVGARFTGVSLLPRAGYRGALDGGEPFRDY